MSHDRQSSSGSPTAPESREAAVRWFARMQSGEMSEADRASLVAWRTVDERNEREFQALQRAWDIAGEVPPGRLQALAQDEGAHFSRPRPATRRSGIAIAACALTLCAAFALYQWQQSQPVFVTAADSVRGERKTMTLPDGSRIDLNTQTRVQVGYYRGRRTVVLAAGEASFSVEPDTGRPFIVSAGTTSIRVTGTLFNVRRDGEEVKVTVLSGHVEVSGPAASSLPVSLTAGEGLDVDAQGQPGKARRLDVAALSAWREGKLVFDGAPLSDVLREVARYRDRPIRLSTPELGQMRVSGTFSINDTDALLAALPRILPLKVRGLPDGGAEIYRP